MILEKEALQVDEFDSTTFVTTRDLTRILDKYDEFKEELVKVFNVDTEKTNVMKIGNAKQLLASINNLDSQCQKVDIVTKVNEITLRKLLEEEKAIFEIVNVSEKYVLKQNRSDILLAETRYAAKADLLEIYNFSKFANYCRDQNYEDLVEMIKNYLKEKNSENNEVLKLRLIYINAENAFYIRAKTSIGDYKNFGINFSVFVALKALSDFVEKTKNEIFINNYVVDDSNLYISFALANTYKINSRLSLSFNLLLENDEVKPSSVSFNGIFKLVYEDGDKTSEILLKPRGYKNADTTYVTDLLTYPHRGSIQNVFSKISNLPTLIEHYITQVKTDAEKISSITHPEDIKKLIHDKIKLSKKPEFKTYKWEVLNKLASISVDNMFALFELLRNVEELFEHNDVVSKDFWRMKLYEALVERK